MKTDLYANLGWPRGTYTHFVVYPRGKTDIGENKKKCYRFYKSTILNTLFFNFVSSNFYNRQFLGSLSSDLFGSGSGFTSSSVDPTSRRTRRRRRRQWSIRRDSLPFGGLRRCTWDASGRWTGTSPGRSRPSPRRKFCRSVKKRVKTVLTVDLTVARVME